MQQLFAFAFYESRSVCKVRKALAFMYSNLQDITGSEVHQHTKSQIHVWQPVAKRHRAYKKPSAARVRGQQTMHSLQPCQLGNDSPLNMVPIPPT